VKYVYRLIEESVSFFSRIKKYGIRAKKLKNGRGTGGKENPRRIPLIIPNNNSLLFSDF
jgi:hypothetical protein